MAVLSKAVTDALYSRYLELVPAGALPWPCEPHSAALVEVRLPIAEALHGAAPNSVGGGVDDRLQPTVEAPIAVASLDSAGLSALADALAEVQAVVAEYGVPLVFTVSIEAASLPSTAREALRVELAKAVKEFAS